MQDPVDAEEGAPNAEVVPLGNVSQQAEGGFRGFDELTPFIFVQQRPDGVQGLLFFCRRLV